MAIFFRPRSLDSLAGYDLHAFVSDLGAGVTVAIIALPLAMAFAIASGVRPEQGLFTAIVAGFLIAALGGSRVQIGGPTGAFVVGGLIYDAFQGLHDRNLCRNGASSCPASRQNRLSKARNLTVNNRRVLRTW